MIRRDSCHAKSVAWTNRVIFPGFIMWATVLWLFGCLASLGGPLVTNSLFSQTCLITISSWALLEPSIPSCVERVETLNTPLWGGLADTDVQRDLFHRESKHSSSRGECQHSGPGRSGEGRKEPKAYHLWTHQQPRCSTTYGSYLQSMLKLVPWFVVTCQRFICIVFVDSSHSSNEDHVKLDFPISLSV